MKISRERFDEIVSAYLDGEASREELELLSKCVRGDRRMAELFYRACRIHAATCAMYGKKAVFGDLDGVRSPFFEAKKTSRVRAAIEWAAVAALMALCASFVWLAVQTMPRHESVPERAASQLPRWINASQTVIDERVVTENGTVFSVIRIKSNAPVGITAYGDEN